MEPFSIGTLIYTILAALAANKALDVGVKLYENKPDKMEKIQKEQQKAQSTLRHRDERKAKEDKAEAEHKQGMEQLKALTLQEGQVKAQGAADRGNIVGQMHQAVGGTGMSSPNIDPRSPMDWTAVLKA